MKPNISVWCKKTLMVGLLIALMGCDNASASTEGITSANVAMNADSINITPQVPKNKPLTILDSSELILDGASTLVITFSTQLDPKQDFSSVVRLVDKEQGTVDGAWELSDNGLELRHRYLSPNRKLILNIDKQISATNGNHLTDAYQFEFTTRDRTPIVGFASKGLLLPSQSTTGLPVMTLNVDRIDVNFYRIRIDDLNDFFRRYGQNINQISIWNSQDIFSYTELAYTGRFDLNPRENVQENILLDLSKIEAFKKDGVYLAVMNQAGKYSYSNPATVFSISNIGISIHSYQKSGFAAFAQALDTGNPLPNVKITVIGNEGQFQEIGSTNENGFLATKFDITDSSLKFLLASDGKQTSFIELGRNALDLSEFGITGAIHQNKQLFMFGPRDLYRPGETVYINALLRDADGKQLPEQPIKVRILKPAGQSASEFILKPIENNVGFYQTKYEIPSDAPTGRWVFNFDIGDDESHQSFFSVEEFLPERMAMEITPISTKPILNSNDAIFDVKGWYLYGAPASNNELQGQVYLKTQRKINGLNDFQIGSISDTSLSRHLTEIYQNLNNEGYSQVRLDSNNWKYIKSPMEISFLASLLDSGGRPVTRTVKQTIWPANQMPAVRPLFNNNEYYDWYSDRYVTRPTVDQGSLAEFEIAYVDIDGKKVTTDELIVRIVKERRDYYWTWSNSEGWQFRYNEKEFILSEDRLAITDNNIAKYGFITDDWGSYRIEVVDPTSKVLTSMRFWSGYNWGDNTNGTGSVRPDQVKLSIDKLSYEPGDTAIVHVEAPTSGKGYISVESNDGVLWSKNIDVPVGGLDVEIPIADWKRHDIYLSSVIVRASENIEVQTIKRAVGILYLPIGVDNRKLNMTLTAPEKTQPEQNVSIKVKVDQSAVNPEKEITVLMSAVDSGVLNITNFVTPDPFTEFLGRKRYNVDQYDIYGKLIEGKGRLVGISFGGDSDDNFEDLSRGGKKPVSEVKIIAQQLKTIKLDENGEGTFELALPDFNGELRLMAQAWSNSRFGKAERKMTLAAPMIVELSTPRFLSGGDRSLMALDLRNLTEQQQQLIVTFKTQGLLGLESQQPISLTLASNERQILQVPVIADYGYGQGKITVSVEGLNFSEMNDTKISRSWVVGVRPGYSSDLRSYSFVLNAGEEWRLPEAALTDLIPNTVEAKLAIANQPPLNVGQYIKSLFAYPYGCLEQTTSGLYPSLYANKEQLAQLGIETDSDENRRRKIEIGIERILGMQRNNGSFGLWSKDSSEEYWLTVYATDFLLRARERGYTVNTQALGKALTRIDEYLYDSSAFYNLNSYYENRKDYIIFATKSYAALVLARQNKLSPAVRNELNRLYVQARKGDANILKSAIPIAQLAIASKYAGYTKASEKLMEIALTTKRDGNYYWPDDYGSDIRDSALILSLLMESNIYPKDQAEYLFKLSNDLKDKRYLSTQELNSLFLAGWQLSNQSREGESWSVNINDNNVKSNKPVSRSYSVKALENGLVIKNPSETNPVYIRFDVSGYTEKAPASTSSQDMLTINRSYYDLQGNRTSIENLNVGDLVIAVLEVNAKKEISDALVVDLLPAGLELENQNLANSSININSITEINDLLKDENSYDVKYQEYRDDRYVTAVNVSRYVSRNLYRKRVMYLARAVTPGSYVVPAPYVESMYHPEWFAIGETIDLMTVKDKSK